MFTISQRYEVGAFASGAFTNLLDYGRSLGLDIQDRRDGGLFIKRGTVTATGRQGDLLKFGRAFDRLVSATNER